MDFETLYDEYSSDVFRFAYYLTGERYEAEDITSETFVKAWSGRSRIRTTTLKAYLFTIARNLFLEGIRKNRNNTTLEDVHIDPSSGPEAAVEARVELERVMKFLAGLGECDRTAFLMRVQHSIPYEDIASMLEISLSSAKVKVHRTRKKLIADRIKKETGIK